MTNDPVLAALARLGVPYERIPIDPALADTEAFCREYGYPLDRSANTIIVASRKEPKRYCACVVLADSKLDVNGTVRKRLGVSRASFAGAQEMKALTGMEVGGVTPFALPPGVPLYVDARVMEPDWVILGGGGRDGKIKISPGVLLTLGGETIEGLGIPRDPLS
jgi:prolyl-tRNA editing enzyme YbaK/EbsC (Cys-tRNA(Pro) deacylase)